MTRNDRLSAIQFKGDYVSRREDNFPKFVECLCDASCVLQVYLADYGLSYRYCPSGIHKEYKENPKKGHNGTIEYTSLDAHKGLSKPSSS